MFVIEEAALEVAARVCLVVVFGFASGLLSPRRGARPRQSNSCRRCSAAIAANPS